MNIKQLIGWERPIKTPLEVQVVNTQFRSSFPEERDQMDFNTWITYIYKQLNPKLKIRKKKIARP
jgi:hypothetical protein